MVLLRWLLVVHGRRNFEREMELDIESNRIGLMNCPRREESKAVDELAQQSIGVES
jgi:hypothetical protein